MFAALLTISLAFFSAAARDSSRASIAAKIDSFGEVLDASSLEAWEEWDALSEAERAARTFEFASSWKNPVQPEPTESSDSEKEKIKQKQKEEEEKKEEEEFLKNVEATTKDKIHDEFVAEKLQDSFKFVEGTYKTWLEESNNGQRVGNEIANLSIKVIGNYSMDGNTPSALNVLHGEVIGRYSQTSVEEVASWVRSLSDV